LIAFESARAEEWYERGLQLLPKLDWRSRACTAAMAGIYRRLLTAIQRDPAAVLRGRLSLPPWQKAGVAVRALARGEP
jgi:phytoene synthase